MHLYVVFEFEDDTLGLVKILLPAYFKVGFLVDGLDANFKTEHPPGYLLLDELHDGRMKNICGNLKLKNIVWSCVVEDELENIQREVFLNIEGPVKELDHPPMCHQVKQVALDVLGGQVANTIVQAGQAEFAFVRTAARGFNVQYPVAKGFRVVVLVRIGTRIFFQRKIDPLLLVDQVTVLFGHDVVDRSNLRILLQEGRERNFTFTGNDKIDAIQLDEGLPVVSNFRPAQQDLGMGVEGLDFLGNSYGLGDVPDITAETDHIKLAAMGSYLVRVFLDGKLLPAQALIALVQLVQKPNGQIHVDVFGVERGQ